eukprot:gene23585-31945_t
MINDISAQNSFQDLLSHLPRLSAQQAAANPVAVTPLFDNPIDKGGQEGSLNPLGNDLLIFLCSTIGIVPLFKYLKASPVIGFLSAGLLMGPCGLGLFSDLNDMESLADFGVLFLLFEQGLELTVDRLRGLSKFAFGMGSLQVLLSSLAFSVFPFVGGVKFLEYFCGAEAGVVDITRVDEALVIGAALSLSSSAFVLQILQENNQLSSRFGAACLGILLLQDIAVVPLLVLLPIIESNGGSITVEAQLTLLGATFLKALLGLGGILVVGGRFVRYLFSIVAKTQSSEAFVALCLLVAVGIGALTDSLGLSSTLGAFAAGTLLAESNYRTQIESDIKPFKGLLLGLFFLTTGASVDPVVIQEQWPTVLALLAGLISFKAIITTCLGPIFGLTKAESVRTGLLLSGGGEFAFVVLTLGDKLNVLPNQLAKILVGVVVLSMALTPYLSKLGDKLGKVVEDYERQQEYELAVEAGSMGNADQGSFVGHDDLSDCDVVVVCGYDKVGETVVRFLTEPSVQAQLEEGRGITRATKYIAFDLDPTLVVKGFKDNKRILYGDGSQPMVLATAGVSSPSMFVVTYGDSEQSVKAVERLRQAFPEVPILARATDTEEYFHLIDAGATLALSDDRESSLSLGVSLLQRLGISSEAVESLGVEIRRSFDLRDRDMLEEISARRKQVNSANDKFGKIYKKINEDSDEQIVDSELKALRQVLSESASSLRRNINADSSPSFINPFFDVLNMFASGLPSFTSNSASAGVSTDSATLSTSTPPTSPPSISGDDALSPTAEAMAEGSPGGSGAIDEQLLGVTVCILPPKKVSSSSSPSD